MSKIHTISNAIAQWSMLLLVALLPFLVVPVSWLTLAQTKVIVTIVLLAVAAFFWCVARLSEGGVRVPLSGVLIAAILLPVAYIISTIVNGFSQNALIGTGVEQDTVVASFLWYGCVALAALIFSSGGWRSIHAIRAMFVGGFILCLAQVVHLFFPNWLSSFAVLSGSTANAIGSWHDLGVMFAFLAFLGFALLGTSAADRTWKLFFALVGGVSMLMLIVINFADIWYGFGILSLLFFVYRILRTRKFPEAFPDFSIKAHLLWIIPIVIAFSFGFFGTKIVGKLPSNLNVAAIEVRPSWQGTYDIGRSTLTTRKTLLFGSGPNSFTRDWGLYKPVGVNQTQFWNIDFNTGIGSVPTSLITLGLVGAIAWLAMLVSLLWLFGKTLLKRQFAQVTRAISVADAVAFSAVFLIVFDVIYAPGPALIMLGFLVIGLLIATAVSAGMLRSAYISITPQSGWGAIGGMAGALVFSLVILFASIGDGRTLASDAYVNRSIVAFNTTQNVQLSGGFIQRALSIDPQSDRAQRAAVELGLVELRDLVNKADPNDAASTAALKSKLEETINHGINAVSIDGSDYQNWLELAGLYQQLAGVKISGAYDNSKAAYMRATQENPTNPLPFFQLAQLEALQGNVNPALQDLKSAIELKPDFAIAFYLASQIYAAQNDFQDALPSAARAVQLAPADPQGWYNLGLIAYTAKDYQDASQSLEQALARQPQFANAMYYLGLSYWNLGRQVDAFSTFQALNSLDPNQPQVLSIMDNLQKGLPPFGETATSTPAKAPAKKK